VRVNKSVHGYKTYHSICKKCKNYQSIILDGDSLKLCDIITRANYFADSAIFLTMSIPGKG